MLSKQPGWCAAGAVKSKQMTTGCCVWCWRFFSLRKSGRERVRRGVGKDVGGKEVDVTAWWSLEMRGCGIGCSRDTDSVGSHSENWCAIVWIVLSSREFGGLLHVLQAATPKVEWRFLWATWSPLVQPMHGVLLGARFLGKIWWAPSKSRTRGYSQWKTRV